MALAGLRYTDGTTTVNLTSTVTVALGYIPKDASRTIGRLEETAYDGATVVDATVPNVTESVRVALLDNNTVSRTTVNTLNALFRQIETRQRRAPAPQVYCEIQVEAGDPWYRTPVHSGTLQWTEGVFGWQWQGKALVIEIEQERAPYWEASTEIEVPLANGNGSGVGGCIIYNHDDGDAGHDNYVDIGNGVIVGDMPAPCRIELVNSTNVAERSYTYWIGQNIWSNPTSFSHILEAEAATGSTTVTESSCSGGAYKNCTWSDEGEAVLLSWTLSSALLQAVAGNYVRVLCRFSTPPIFNNVFFKLRIKFNLSPIWQSPEMQILAERELQELASMQLPPLLMASPSVHPLTLELIARQSSSGAHSNQIDYLQLTPLDGWRVLEPKGYGLAYNARLADDGMTKELWTDGWASGGRSGHYLGYGEPVRLWPRRVQRLYILHDTDVDRATITRTTTVRIYYRPRRSTL
jgi:hypothetical protein